DVDDVVQNLAIKSLPCGLNVGRVLSPMQSLHFRADAIGHGQQRIDNEVEFEDEALLFELEKFGLEQVTRIGPVSADLSQREFGVSQVHATGVDDIED